MTRADRGVRFLPCVSESGWAEMSRGGRSERFAGGRSCAISAGLGSCFRCTYRARAGPGRAGPGRTRLGRTCAISAGLGSWIVMALFPAPPRPAPAAPAARRQPADPSRHWPRRGGPAPRPAGGGRSRPPRSRGRHWGPAPGPHGEIRGGKHAARFARPASRGPDTAQRGPAGKDFPRGAIEPAARAARAKKAAAATAGDWGKKGDLWVGGRGPIPRTRGRPRPRGRGRRKWGPAEGTCGSGGVVLLGVVLRGVPLGVLPGPAGRLRGGEGGWGFCVSASRTWTRSACVGGGLPGRAWGEERTDRGPRAGHILAARNERGVRGFRVSRGGAGGGVDGGRVSPGGT